MSSHSTKSTASVRDSETTSSACRNCGSLLDGPYCSACGQQDRPLELPFRDMVVDWFGTVVAFDSRLAHTMWPLIRRPGWLTTEYLAGRRVRYVPPLRLYFFISLLMLFGMAWENTALFSTGNSDSGLTLTNEDGESVLEPEASEPVAAPAPAIPEEDADSGAVSTAAAEAAASASAGAGDEEAEDSFGDFLERRLVQPYRADPEAFNRKFRSRLGQTLFFLVPMFALITKLLFRRPRPYYFHHLVFSLHVHAFAFLLLTIDIVLSMIGLPELGGLSGLILMVYIFKAMRLFSQQSRWRVFGKLLVVAVLYNFTILFTLLGTLALTVVLPA